MDFLKMFKDAGKIQEQLRERQEELEAMTFEGQSGAGMVKVVANGKQEILRIVLEEGLVEKVGESMLPELIAGAVNEALKKARENAKTGMMKVFEDLGLNPPNL
ncbi:MAG: nucleoid-associated protein, YbaB/EbfC family [Deltaproteobacteria bacterium RIFCSPLOWO2_02_FULL_50_16]|nr:MAG: nucleoid-associated protein, YbaB/EbfC family [Deltaproteobacteria bacterium RIFCSPHIGHO2_02_FULL_50_15]OGQ58050.1 MAG: nucleoid-associated protein, YbaB/EbfC family [Deltaproteobacteria bacterium RIFCSPLOWO2_02_FULL_50_16]OGQ67129.1 MAG: nucleoid-associated protein, YbaB/EbfC family [Deltaproteobacteria bacterium RIFCSPLOWO2_12_FULL_50_11]